MVLGLAVLLAAAVAGTAAAETRTCNSVPCNGTDNNDVLYERLGNEKADKIYGLEGDDVIDANTFAYDRDQLFGRSGDDRLLTNDGDTKDVIKGGPGHDVCYADRGDTTRSCEVLRRGESAGTSDVAQDLKAEAFTTGR
jgi:hypothetical protein